MEDRRATVTDALQSTTFRLLVCGRPGDRGGGTETPADGQQKTMSKLLRERLLAQREALDAAMAALRAVGAGAAASAPAGQQEALDASLPDQAPPAIPHALLLALIGMDDAGLRREFDTHADLAADDKGERRMSKAGLASFMHGQGLCDGQGSCD